MTKSLNKRKKIILLFSLGIGCPSLILGYLAFRGIQNDQALLEKERVIEHRQIAQQIIESISDSLRKVEADFYQKMANQKKQKVPDLVSSIHQIKNQNPLIEEVFSIDNYKQITFPAARLPYRLSTSQQTSTGKKSLFL